MAGKRILLVDDDEGLKRFCSEVLTVAGYNVELASDGVEAYGKLQEASFDLVITGIRLRGLDGIGLYLDTLKIYSNMREKFLFMEDETCAQDEHAQDEKYLVKPFNVGELLKKVESLTGVNLTAFLMKYRNIGENRRSGRRFCWTEDMRLTEKGHASRPFAQTVDASQYGLRIRYIGSPLEPECVVQVEVRCIRVSTKALIVWSKALDERESASGLRLAEPVPASSLRALTQSRRPFIPPLVSGPSE